MSGIECFFGKELNLSLFGIITNYSSGNRVFVEVNLLGNKARFRGEWAYAKVCVI